MKTLIANVKFPVGGDLLCALIDAAVKHPPAGYSSSDIRLGETDRDTGFTPIFAEKEDSK